MTSKSAKQDLHKAKRQKKDEFYTQLSDIEKELKYYKDHFQDKVVYCNCDDPTRSNFFQYFWLNFNVLGLKKLITTCYKSQNHEFFSNHDQEKSLGIELERNHGEEERLPDINVFRLRGDGDFRSEECIELLKQSDIVVTNPPFSLFREYVGQLMEHEKEFIVIGNINAINYKEVFPLIQSNRVWLGPSISSGDREFGVPNHYPLEAAGYRVDSQGNKFIRVKGVRWFTNLNYPKRHEDLILYKKYSPDEYPKYDNYDAIEVSKTRDIPMDYEGVMGVPITFLDKYNPDQFEILGLSQKVGFGLESNKVYDDYEETRQDGSKTGSSGKKTNGNPVMKGMPKKGNFYTNGNQVVYSLYGRIFIRNKNPDEN